MEGLFLVLEEKVDPNGVISTIKSDAFKLVWIDTGGETVATVCGPA